MASWLAGRATALAVALQASRNVRSRRGSAVSLESCTDVQASSTASAVVVTDGFHGTDVVDFVGRCVLPRVVVAMASPLH
jgi:hypothetical protein